MKKGLALIIAGALVISASADLTQFAWSGGTLADESGGVIPYGQATVFTFLDTDAIPDLWSFISGSVYNITDLQGFTADSVNPTVGPPFGPQNDLATSNMDFGVSITGKYAYAIVVNAVGYTSIADIQIGDYFGITDVTGPFSSGLPPLPGTVSPIPPPSYNPGAVQTNIEVVPEPSVVGLMGIAGLSLFLTRRKAQCIPAKKTRMRVCLKLKG